MKKRNKSLKVFRINNCLRVIKQFQNLNLKKLSQRLQNLEIQRDVDASKLYLYKSNIERTLFYSCLALVISVFSLIFSIWK